MKNESGRWGLGGHWDNPTKNNVLEFGDDCENRSGWLQVANELVGEVSYIQMKS